MGAREYLRRRRQLMKMIGSDGIAILPAAPVRFRNRDTAYPYRQDSDLLYLTGFPEPEAVAVLVPGREPAEFILFCRERDPEREAWDGPLIGPDGAVEDHGADDAFPMEDIDEILPGLMEHRERVYYNVGRDPEFDKRVIGWINRLRAEAGQGNSSPYELVALDHVVHDLRLYKSRQELTAMRRAARITVGAHERAMAFAAPGRREYEVAAEIEHEFHRHRAVSAYPPIVGGGDNACILHYIENRAVLEAGRLLLIDAGCELDGYASDVTRTFPVDGRFSDDQRAVYEIVLAAQHAAIEAVRPGEHWNAPHEAAVTTITRGLVELGILEGAVDRLVRDGAYRRFFMHRTGHWLGLDVHDVGDYKVGEEWRVLEPGMVMTVEPGIYIPPGSQGVDPRWQGIGVRIEDDVAVTRDGHEILSGDLPREVAEIEALVGAA